MSSTSLWARNVLTPALCDNAGMPIPGPPTTRLLVAAVAVLSGSAVVALAGCSDDDRGTAGTTTEAVADDAAGEAVELTPSRHLALG